MNRINGFEVSDKIKRHRHLVTGKGQNEMHRIVFYSGITKRKQINSFGDVVEAGAMLVERKEKQIPAKVNKFVKYTGNLSNLR